MVAERVGCGLLVSARSQHHHDPALSSALSSALTIPASVRALQGYESTNDQAYGAPCPTRSP
eukprot:3594430-Pleurochrysis_carterae.AAC.1